MSTVRTNEGEFFLGGGGWDQTRGKTKQKKVNQCQRLTWLVLRNAVITFFFSLSFQIYRRFKKKKLMLCCPPPCSTCEPFHPIASQAILMFQ